jgi:hypothetical protein
MKYLTENSTVQDIILFFVEDNPGINLPQLREKVNHRLFPRRELGDKEFADVIDGLNKSEELIEWTVIVPSRGIEFIFFPRHAILSQYRKRDWD